MASFLLLLLLIVASWTESVSPLQPPQNITKGLLNLNYELRWAAPHDETNTTMYTVEYRGYRNGNWKAIEQCTNITRTECTNMTQSLIAQYGQKAVQGAVLIGFSVRVYRHDGPVDSASLTSSVVTEFFPYTEAVIGAPSIRELGATSDSLQLGLVAPLTPLINEKTGEYMRMDDRNLQGVSRVYYNYTVWRGAQGMLDTEPWTMVERREDVPSRRGMREFTRLPLTDLIPNTKYKVAVQARIGIGRYSENSAAVDLKTREAAPSQGPALMPIETTDVDCSRPDSRDARISWKPPPIDRWRGDRLHYEIRVSRIEANREHVTLLNTSSMSTTLHGLSRWNRYDIVVLANTSAGGTPSLQRSLPATVVGMANSRPDALHVINVSQSKHVVAWKPPPGYHQCILGYQVTLQPEVGDGREMTVKNETSLELRGLQRGTYMVEVVAIVKTGFNATSLGVAGNIRLVVGPVADSGRVVLYVSLIAAIVVIVCTILTAVLCRRCFIAVCKDEKFKSLNNNKILKRASSQTYSQLRRQVSCEKETYDLPNNQEPLERQTSVSRYSGTSNRTNTSSSGYSTDVKSGAVDDEIWNANDDGKARDDDVDSNHSLMQYDFPDDEDDALSNDSVFEALMRAAVETETSLQESAISGQSWSRGPIDVASSQGDDSAALALGYTPISSCRASRQASVDEDSYRKASMGCDSAPSSPNSDIYPTVSCLGYTVLANCSLTPPHTPGVTEYNPLEAQTGTNPPDTRISGKYAVKNANNMANSATQKPPLTLVI